MGLDDAEFDALALALFVHALRNNAPYRAFCATAGYSEQRLPQSWRAIPAVPSSAFKDATLATFDPATAAGGVVNVICPPAGLPMPVTL